MTVLSKIVVIAGAIKAASAVKAYEDHAGPGATAVATVDLASVEIGQLLSTACTPLTIYTEECHIVTVDTTTEPVTDDRILTSEIVLETTESIATGITSSSIELEATTSEDVLEPTAEVTAGVAGMGVHLVEAACLILSVLALNL